MTHSFAQATLEIGGPGNKNKNSACRAASSTARNPRVANHSPTPTPVGYDLGGSRDSLLVGRCQPNQEITWILWTGYWRKPGCSWFPAGQPRAGLWGEDGLAETLALQATRINGRCPPPNHCSPADRRLGMVEIEFGAFLPGRHQDGGSAGACHPHGRFAVQTLT